MICTMGISKLGTDNLKSCNIHCNAPVICVSGPLGAGDTGDIAGLKCRDLTADAANQLFFRCLDSILNIHTCQILNFKT